MSLTRIYMMKEIIMIVFLLTSCAGVKKGDRKMLIDSIPLKISKSEEGAILAHIDVYVDGQKREFLLDTGAVASYIGEDEFTQKYKSVGTGKSTGASGKSIPCDYIQPKTITLGKKEIHEYRIKRCAKKDLIGLDLLSNTIFQIDLKSNAINIFEKFDNLPDKIKRLETGHLTIPLNILEKETFVLFDSGADTTVIDSKFISENSSLFEVIREEEGTDGNGVKIKSKVYAAKKIKIGHLELENVEMAAFEFGDHLRSKMEGTPIILGNNVISKAKWTFDLENGVWGSD